MRVYKAKDGWRWRFSSGSDITADSGEAYTRKASAKRAAVRVVLAMHGPIKWTFDKAR